MFSPSSFLSLDRYQTIDAIDVAAFGYLSLPKTLPVRFALNCGITACSQVMCAIVKLLILGLLDCFKSRGRLEVEVMVLRHQLSILYRKAPKRIRPNAVDRAIFVWLYRLFPDIGNAVAIFRPETIVRWHRIGFRTW